MSLIRRLFGRKFETYDAGTIGFNFACLMLGPDASWEMVSQIRGQRLQRLACGYRNLRSQHRPCRYAAERAQVALHWERVEHCPPWNARRLR